MGQWILPKDKRWMAILAEAEHDFYHLPCYVELASSLDHGEPRAFYEELGTGQLLIPLLVRNMASDCVNGTSFLDATSPYGFPGPLFSKNISTQDAITGIQRFVEFGKEAHLVTTFLRLHPFQHSQIWSAYSEDENVNIVTHGSTVSIDLTLETSELDRRLRKNHRKNIDKLKTLGFDVVIDNWQEFPAFIDIYYETMRRRGATPYYFFNEEYFTQLRHCLGSSLHLCSIFAPRGEIASAGLFVKTGDIVQAHLSSTSDKYLSNAPSKLMFCEMRNWAKAAGAKKFHLGGGIGGERDSLFLFKHGLSTHEHCFNTVGIIHDFNAYNNLYRRWLKLHVDGSLNAGFFPFYRNRESQ